MGSAADAGEVSVRHWPPRDSLVPLALLPSSQGTELDRSQELPAAELQHMPEPPP